MHKITQQKAMYKTVNNIWCLGTTPQQCGLLNPQGLDITWINQTTLCHAYKTLMLNPRDPHVLPNPRDLCVLLIHTNNSNTFTLKL